MYNTNPSFSGQKMSKNCEYYTQDLMVCGQDITHPYQQTLVFNESSTASHETNDENDDAGDNT